ncbi:MAG: nitrogen regulation protein NR(II) [Chromatiales bacterium]
MISVQEVQRLVDSLTTAVLIFDRTLGLQYLNSAAEAMLSISARKALGEPAGKLFASAPALLLENLQRAQATGQPFTEREVELRPSHGEAITVDCIITPILEDRQRPQVLLELVNVDRLHQIVREESMNSQQKMTSALLRGMAHEVKNPLGGIRGAAQLLERELTSEAHREYTRIIVGEVDRLRKLIDRMLIPEMANHRLVVNVHEILEHVRSLVQAEASGITVHRDYDPSLPNLYADRDQLVQAVLNVVRNAVQAVHDGGDITLRTRIERQLTIGGRPHRLVVRVDVIDSGAGIPEEIADQIFYPMVSGRPDGTGLGLSITHALIHRLGGMIAFTSRPGRTVFSICLPAGPHDQSE